MIKLALVYLTALLVVVSAEKPVVPHLGCNLWPMFAGGDKHDETITRNCFIIDEENELIIVGGTSKSFDFVKTTAEKPVAFLYATNL
jgi:hypothetical protein